MTPRNTVLIGDVIERLRELPDNSIDAIVTDPPYGLEFMGKEWDGFDSAHAFGEWCRQWGVEALRVLKPGGYLLAFGGTRTYHRLVSGLEDAGFEIRDTIAWLYGSGFPKSLDVSKAIDKAARVERESKGWLERKRTGVFAGDSGEVTATSGKLQCPVCLKWKFAPDHCTCPRDNGPQTPAAQQWQGFGTALKPAHEPIVLARKPFRGTVAANVTEHRTGALNIDGCRLPTDERFGGGAAASSGFVDGYERGDGWVAGSSLGRWPANVAHDGSVEVLELFPEGSFNKAGVFGRDENGSRQPGYGMGERDVFGYGDRGSAARFFYCAKASRADREAGLVGLPMRTAGVGDERPSGSYQERRGQPAVQPRANDHPTVKPHELMRWLCRLVGGQRGSLILDPFAGSGSTLRAAVAEGFDFLGIERDRHYYRLACLRAGLPDPGEEAA